MGEALTGGPVQTASSLGSYPRTNSDGTITVRCRICGNSICDVDGRNRFCSATCAICEREEKGEILSEAMELQLRSMRMPDGNRLPYSVITPIPVQDPGLIGYEDSAKVGKPEYWYRVIQQKVQKIVAKAKVKKAAKYVESTAQELATLKRHKGLFSGGIEVNIKKNKE
jgi:hypothetical protein